jgi:hypothetical protein
MLGISVWRQNRISPTNIRQKVSKNGGLCLAFDWHPLDIYVYHSVPGSVSTGSLSLAHRWDLFTEDRNSRHKLSQGLAVTLKGSVSEFYSQASDFSPAAKIDDELELLVFNIPAALCTLGCTYLAEGGSTSRFHVVLLTEVQVMWI